MQRKALLVLPLIALLFINITYASEGRTLLLDDFAEGHWTQPEGYAVFKSSSVTLIPNSTNHKSSIQYYKTLKELNNDTWLNRVYVSFDFTPTWSSSENSEVGVYINNETNPSIFYGLRILHNSSGEFFKASTDGYTFITKLNMSIHEGIFSFDGDYALLYQPNGNVVASHELGNGTMNFKEFRFRTDYQDKCIINSYGFYTTLKEATHGQIATKATEAVFQFVPVIVSLMMLSVALGFITKFGR